MKKIDQVIKNLESEVKAMQDLIISGRQFDEFYTEYKILRKLLIIFKRVNADEND